ncbi:hypothetical protein JHK87_000330 [Glycine soja]|nr:hypothetical protein JHK87_000330 [Glycine soja]
MRRKRLTLKIRSKKRFSNKKLQLPYVSYALPPIVLFCFCVFFYCHFFTSSPANEPPHSISISNHSSLAISTELIPHSISITNHSSLSASPPPPPPPPVYEKPNDKKIVYEKPCDYTNGRWIRTKRNPLYNSTTCVNLKESRNCIANGRPDLGFLYWKWKPSECYLPRFEPNTFLQLISNKHVAFVGDSLSRNHLESLLCMLNTVTKPNGFSHQSFTRWLFPSHNATLSFYWSPFLVQGVERNNQGPRYNNYNKIHLDHANMRWEKDMDQMDMIVLSLGHWFLIPSVFYWDDKVIGCVNRPVSNCTTDIGFYGPIRRALRTALNSIIKKKVKKGNGIDVILRTYSPSHFEGAWDKGGICSKTEPYRAGERQLEGENAMIRRIQFEEVERAKARAKELVKAKPKAEKFKGFRLEVLDVTKLALLRPDGHPGAYMNPFPFAKGVSKHVQNDCVHWCLPGPIDTWNEIFLEMMKNMAQAAEE